MTILTDNTKLFKIMDKRFRWMITVIVTVASVHVSAQTFKLSGGLREMLNSPVPSMTRGATSDDSISVLMKVAEARQLPAVCADYGMTLTADLGNIGVVNISLKQLQAAAADERVIRMEKEGGFHLCLDDVRKHVNMAPVADGQSPLAQAYTGKNVLVGVLDGGIQYNHPTFLDANSQPRFIKVWDYDPTADGQSSTAVVLTDPAAIVARKFSYSSKYALGKTNHASHVAGIAVGRGSADGHYRGMAPESDILFAEFNVNPFSQDRYGAYSDGMVVAIKNMMDYAIEQQKPLVVNISLGINTGFSTEIKLFQEAVGRLTGPGRIIVSANGNEGGANSYFNSGNNQNVSMELTSESQPMPVEMLWRTTGSITLRANVLPKDGTARQIDFNTADMKNGMLPSVDCETYTASCMQLDDAPDGKHIYKMILTPKAGSIMAFSISMDAISTAGFEYYSAAAIPQSYTPTTGCTQSNAYTVALPAAFPNVIGVGNYCNQVLPNEYYVNENGEKVTDVVTGVMANSSACGPTWDGRTKPDVSAPGSSISSGNCYYEKNGDDVVETKPIAGSDATETWVCQFGTSQASPVVSGIVALWLQAKPQLTPDDVLAVIRRTAKPIEDVPNNHSGAGIIDAYAGLLDVLGLATGISALSQHQPLGVSFRVADGRLYAEGAEEGTAVTIYNISGVAVRQSIINQGFVSLAGLSRGVYAVQLGRQGSTLIRLGSF